MTWFRVDDQFTRHEKYHLAGKDGRALWYAVGVECAALSTDGRVPAHMLKPWAAAAGVAPRLARQLVAAGLWHDSETITACPRCLTTRADHGAPELAQGDHYFHDWDVYQLDREGRDDPMHRFRELRRKSLHRSPMLKASIRTRDRDLCRYCGELTIWGNDHKSALSGTFDHVDPFGENSRENLVVACRLDNGRKRDRTPEQAGMVLLPEPSYEPDHGLDIQPGTQPIQPADPVRSSRDARGGTDRVGNGSGAGSGLDRAGSANGNGHG